MQIVDQLPAPVLELGPEPLPALNFEFYY